MAGTITQAVSWWCYVPGLLAADEFVAAAKRAGFTAIDLVPRNIGRVSETAGCRSLRQSGMPRLSWG